MGFSDGIKMNELKKQLHKLALEIVNDDNGDGNDVVVDDGVIIGVINNAIKSLIAYKELNLRSNKNKKRESLISSQLDCLNVPHQFRCPISRQLMRDPVVLSTGQTYDRPYIQKWLNEGQRTCPQTQQVLSHTVLTPNHLVRELIDQWCNDHGLDLPPPGHDPDDQAITDADRGHLNSLLDKMSSSLSEQKQAAKQIRFLTKRMPSFRSFFCESTDAIAQLLTPLTRLGNLKDYPDLQEDLITTVLNLSIHDSNKTLIAEHPLVIPLLIESLTCGTIETRANSGAALFTLSALDSNKHLIGKLGALKPLINLLEEGHPLAMKDAASAIFNLCVVVENRGRAVRDGAIKVITEKIKARVLVDELLTILAMLASHQGAIEELGELGAVGCLLDIIRENTCERNKENCIAILHSICIYNRAMLKEVRVEESSNRTISKLAENGTLRAKRKANGILERLKRGINLAHTA